jgi:DNA-binding MarR family transcriptional regulator
MTYDKSINGRVFDASLRDDAEKLHVHLPNLEPRVFEVFLLLARAYYATRRIGDKTRAGLGLTPHQFQALRFLLIDDESRLRIGDLAGRLGISSVNCTKLVNRMQKAGMVRRELDARDRRVVWAVLTEAGRERYIATLPISSIDLALYAGFDQSEQDTLIDLLSRITLRAEELEKAASVNEGAHTASQGASMAAANAQVQRRSPSGTKQTVALAKR